MASVGKAGDQWQAALSKHALFSRLRERTRAAEEKGEKAEGKSGGPLQLRSLICTVDGDLLVWDQEECSFCTIRLKSLDSDMAGSGREQKLLCINPPLFDVVEVLLSPTQNHIALIGTKGLMVLEVPKRWGKNSEFEGGESTVNCRTIPVAERIFASSTSIILKQAIWFPSKTEELHLILLTSDNAVSIYSLQNPLTPEKVIRLCNADKEATFPHSGRSYKASLGETAIACDFGPLVTLSKGSGIYSKETLAYPLYILYENGETFLMYIDIQKSATNVGKLLGPLSMHPAADDNYGYDACAVLCLPCVPNILVIATESGLLYHCVVLEGEEDEQASEKSWNPSMDLLPSLYVFECVELELALKLPVDNEESVVSYFSCPIKLHKDLICPSRYHCTHVAGVHSVGLTWLSKLETFLDTGEEDKDSLQVLAAEQKCLVEHILCTKPLPCRSPAPIQGFWIIHEVSLGTTMICITSGCECITRPLLATIRPPSPLTLGCQPLPNITADTKRQFENHIQDILRRNSANPLLLNSSNKESSPPPDECLQLLTRAIQVFREEYLLKQDLAREEMQRRVKLLIAQKDKQLKDLNHSKEERQSLKEMAERLAEKFEEAKEKQDDIINRLKRVLHNLHAQLPVVSDEERDMRKELETTREQLHHLENAIKQVKMKNSYQQKQIEKERGPKTSSFTLSDYQKRNTQSLLKEEGKHIQEMMKLINDIRSHVNF